MFNLFYWGLFGSKLDEEWERKNPEEAAKMKYFERRYEYERQLKKHPKAEKTIRQLDCEDYRQYVRRMLEIGGSGIIERFEDL